MNPTTQLEQYQSQTPDPQTSQKSCEAHEDLLGCPYGRRYIRRVNDDGEIVYDEVPLALEDLLHPEADDELVAVLGHSKDCGRLSTGLDRLIPPNKTFVVLEDVNVDLGLPGVKPIRPDVGVFEVAAIPDGLRDMGTFDMNQHAAVPVLFIEVTSGSTRPNDLGPKFRMYEQAKVQQFILVDRVHPSGTPQLAGFEYRGEGFVELQPDPQGRFWLSAFDLWIGLEAGVAVLYDANGLVPDSEGLAKQVETERIRADSAEERMRELEAELARIRSQ
ncbi:MAG: Uma2 family endonuclease [Planctomycetota bacterium]|nr:Uma2 family endonuclease [Planctomycetota bacterium]